MALRRKRSLERPTAWVLVAVAAHISGHHVVVAERTSDGASEADSRAAAAPVEPTRQDLIAQELEELEGLLELNEKRIGLLEKLQSAVASGSLDEGQAQALRAEIPMVSDIVAQPHVFPAAAPEDYLISKARIRMDRRTTLIKWLPVRASPKYSSKQAEPLAPPAALLVATGPEGTVGFYASSGEQLLSFEAGHDGNVTLLAVSPSWAQGDMLIATGDAAGVVRVHRVAVQQRKGGRPRTHDAVSLQNDTQYLGGTVAGTVNVTVHFQRQLEALSGVDGDIPRMTALAMASQQGSKYFVVGDAEGKISVFTLSGAFRSRMDATFSPGHGIDSFYVHMSQLLFRAGPEWGYIDLENLEVKHIECPDFDGNRVIAAIIDSQQSQRVLAADEEGTLWSFVVRHARSCRVERKFPKDISRAPVDLASIRGFVLTLEYGQTSSTLTALNMSHVRHEDLGSPVVFRRTSPPVRAWAVYRHRQDGPASDLIALLSEDGMEVEVLELLMTITIIVPGQPIWLNGWITLPIIISLVLMSVFWHYLKYGRTLASSKEGAAEGGNGGAEGESSPMGGLAGVPM